MEAVVRPIMTKRRAAGIAAAIVTAIASSVATIAAAMNRAESRAQAVAVAVVNERVRQHDEELHDLKADIHQLDVGQKALQVDMGVLLDRSGGRPAGR